MQKEDWYIHSVNTSDNEKENKEVLLTSNNTNLQFIVITTNLMTNEMRHFCF